MEVDFTQSFPSIDCRYPKELDLFRSILCSDDRCFVDLLISWSVELLEMDVFPAEGDFKYVSFFESHLLGVSSTN